MKRILSLLLVALMIFGLLPTNAITASAAETTVTLTVTGSTGTKSSDSSSISWTSDGVTFTNVKGSTAIRTSDSNHYRIYAGSSATISAPGNITKIVVTCTSSSYATVFKNSVGSEVTVSGSAVTIIPTASSTSYSISNFTAQTRISAVAVTYAEATPSCEHTNTTENSDGYAATCTETGMTNSVTCNDCGETVTAQKVIPALGHSYVDGVCQNCGNKLPVVSFSVPSQVDGVDSIIANESGVVTLPSAATTYTGKYAYTFVGWTTGTVSDTETEPTLYTANSAYTPAENTTLYAVYTYDIEGEGSTGTATEYELYSGDLTEGDYLIVYESSAMNTTVSSSRLMFDTVTATNNVISNPAADIIWHIAPDGDYWTIYNTEKGAYAASTGAKNKATVDTSITDNARWTVSGTSTYEFINKANAASSVNANLRKNGTYGFACYSTSTGGALSLYKAVTSSGTTLTTFYTTTLEDLDTTCQHPNTTETTVNASCTEDGKTTVTCDDCGAVISTEVIEATGHSYNSVVTDPTCTAAGYITYTCSLQPFYIA